MKINNVSELKLLLQPILDKKIAKPLQYILLNTSVATFKNDFSTELKKYDNDVLSVVTLLVKHPDNKIDFFLVICCPNEIDEKFQSIFFKDFLGNIKIEALPLSFLEKNWETNPGRYQCVFHWATTFDATTTHINYCAVAPTMRGNGLMKQLSLELLKLLSRQYGEDHIMSSILIHPATHLFFKPYDKECKQYQEGEWEEISCKHILMAHGVQNSTTNLKVVGNFGIFPVSSKNEDVNNNNKPEINLPTIELD